MTVTMLGGALSLLVPACSGGTEDADETPRRSTTTEPEATTTTLNPEEAKRQEVIAAREAADEAQGDALGPPSANPDVPALAATHTGLMLDRLKETASGLRAAGVAVRLPEDSRQSLEVESIRFDQIDGQEVAYLVVCTVEDSERVQLASGKVVRTGVVTIESTEAMRKVDGAWKLAERRQDSVEEGEVGCAIDN